VQLEHRCRRIANNESCTRSNLAEDFRQDLARVDVPTLVIHGDDDRYRMVGKQERMMRFPVS
jgi:pimeloyl-ACP methyl ester carboxylesterase